MELNELDKLKKCSTETDIIKIVEEIDDKVIYKYYTGQQILSLVNEIIKMNLLSVTYETREEILHFLCDVVAYYGLLDGVNWENMIKIRDHLEDDLKEYVSDIMEGDKISRVTSLLYDCTNDEAQVIISLTEDPEVLYMYAYNYNWDNGFEIPLSILDHKKCNLSIALLIFYRADGASYLLNKSYSESLPQWSTFIKKLYETIIDEKYQKGEIEFKAPLSKVELYKLKKILSEKEMIFIENMEGRNLDIHL